MYLLTVGLPGISSVAAPYFPCPPSMMKPVLNGLTFTRASK
jgi:hypothetical protein